MEDFEAYGQLQARSIALPAELPDVLAPPRPRRSHWLRNLILVVLAYGFLAVATTVQPIAIPFTGAKVSVPFPGGPSLLFGLPDRPFTVVVIGLDRRPSETGASRTDTVLLVRIDPGAHRAAFLSIPRDSLMEITTSGGVIRDRINTAFVYNYSREDSGAAPRAVMETIEHNFGIPVDHYVIFDQRSAEDLIDALGGVTIDNPEEFGQDNYSNDDVNVVPQFFPEGELSLDGYQAVAYGRIREGSNDFERIERQQRVGSALIDRASSPLSLWRMPGAWGAFRKTVTTDMSMRQSAGVLSLLKRVSDDDLKTKSLGDAAVSCASCVASIQLLDPVRVEQIITEAFGDPAAGRLAAERLVAAGVGP
ncbi:MAG: LCP family protein [Dehalococcoidia bacterium]